MLRTLFIRVGLYSLLACLVSLAFVAYTLIATPSYSVGLWSASWLFSPTQTHRPSSTPWLAKELRPNAAKDKESTKTNPLNHTSTLLDALTKPDAHFSQVYALSGPSAAFATVHRDGRIDVNSTPLSPPMLGLYEALPESLLRFADRGALKRVWYQTFFTHHFAQKSGWRLPTVQYFVYWRAPDSFKDGRFKGPGSTFDAGSNTCAVYLPVDEYGHVDGGQIDPERETLFVVAHELAHCEQMANSAKAELGPLEPWEMLLTGIEPLCLNSAHKSFSTQTLVDQQLTERLYEAYADSRAATLLYWVSNVWRSEISPVHVAPFFPNFDTSVALALIESARLSRSVPLQRAIWGGNAGTEHASDAGMHEFHLRWKENILKSGSTNLFNEHAERHLDSFFRSSYKSSCTQIYALWAPLMPLTFESLPLFTDADKKASQALWMRLSGEPHVLSSVQQSALHLRQRMDLDRAAFSFSRAQTLSTRTLKLHLAGLPLYR